MIEPLRMSFVVECSDDHAFATWTERATSWWPAAHTVSHQRGTEIVFEPRPGGRVFERTPGGDEFDWGEVVDWDPPHRLRYLWRIATTPENATDVEIRFERLSDSATRVEIEHGGWERLAEFGPEWRRVNTGGWHGVLPAYRTAARR